MISIISLTKWQGLALNQRLLESSQLFYFLEATWEEKAMIIAFYTILDNKMIKKIYQEVIY